jgi:hypothetical protein
VTQFKDGEVDFVYIDGDHGFDAVKADISAWWPKVKNGGILAGHDYCGMQAGVKSAVDEFQKSTQFQLNVTDTASSDESYEIKIEFGEEAGAESWWFNKESA